MLAARATVKKRTRIPERFRMTFSAVRLRDDVCAEQDQKKRENPVAELQENVIPQNRRGSVSPIQIRGCVCGTQFIHEDDYGDREQYSQWSPLQRQDDRDSGD